MELILDCFFFLSGHYMTINALYISEHSSSSTRHTLHLVSPSFDPAPNYCIRFWYNMHGSDVQPLKVYAKVPVRFHIFSIGLVQFTVEIKPIIYLKIYQLQINSGLGYPIKVITPVNSVNWKLGEVEIDSEYTANRFQVPTQQSELSNSPTYLRQSRNENMSPFILNNSVSFVDSV